MNEAANINWNAVGVLSGIVLFLFSLLAGYVTLFIDWRLVRQRDAIMDHIDIKVKEISDKFVMKDLLEKDLKYLSEKVDIANRLDRLYEEKQ